ncbi:MAG: carboxypeptidase-like regulatory domain-containing protein [bacterium]|nr:carboxypeptidase-like regulatory domain-containing protein [bacterium]
MKTNTKFSLLLLTALAAGFLLISSPASASISSGTVNATYKYAWAENVGWINFGASEGAVTVTDSALTGYAWGENIGWISLNCANTASCNTVDYKVANDGSGNLSGYAWSENAGWINFNPTGGGVNIDPNGDFSGYAWGENTGWIVFNCATTNSCSGVNYRTSTDWNQQGMRPQCNNGLDDDADGKIDYPADPGCGSLVDTDEKTQGSTPPVTIMGGGASLPIPTVFKVLINEGQPITGSRFARLRLTGNEETALVAISNFFDFQGVSLSPYQEFVDWDLCRGRQDCPEGQYAVYVRFYNRQGYPSDTVSASIALKFVEAPAEETPPSPTIIIKQPAAAPPVPLLEKLPSVLQPWLPESIKDLSRILGQPTPIFKRLPEALERILPDFFQPGMPGVIPPEIMQKLLPQIFPLSTSRIKPPEIPLEKLIPKQAPLALQGGWQLMPSKPLALFVLAPLPKDIHNLARKIPQLEKTFNQVGINRVTDVRRIASAKINLPGLTETVGMPASGMTAKKMGVVKGVPVASLTSEFKEKIPQEIIFAKGAGELVDYKMLLSITDKGKPQETVRTLVGQTMRLVVKPEQKVKSVKGYLVFKSKTPRASSMEIPINSFLASIFARPVLAKQLEQPVEVEERLVLMEFEYTDPDGDGIYTADIQTPLVDGEYEIITVMDYANPELGSKEIRLVTVVDPEGYVYEKDGDKETRVPGAIAALFWLNPVTKQYELWPAPDYQQENPQITDTRGTYAFLVPEGLYYLKVEAPGYLSYDGRPFQVKEGSGIHVNIELKTKYWWLKLIEWKTIALVLVVLLLIYNFYKDKKRERAAKKASG